MPERPDDPPPVPRQRTDREQAAATRRRETERKAPPIPDVKPPFPTEPPLTLALADLAPWWLELRCGCGHLTYYPLRLLAAERGWRTPLGETLPRLRCARCHAKPATIDLLASPADGAMGAASFDAVGGPRLRLRPS
jgi:hypothetical protein